MDSLIGLQSNNSTEEKESTLARKLRHTRIMQSLHLILADSIVLCSVQMLNTSVRRKWLTNATQGIVLLFLLAQSSRQ